jgi:isochorismate synthase
VALFERPLPDAVSAALLGTAYEIVSTSAGARLLDAAGVELDAAAGPPLTAAAALWRRLAAELAQPPPLPGAGLVAFAGFAFRPEREPAGAWSGFPGVLLRVPALALTRVRGRTFATALGEDADGLLEPSPGFAAPRARTLRWEPVRPPEEWMRAVADAAGRLEAGGLEKVVLAREVIAHGDGPVSAGAVARALRTAYPSCYTYLVTGADGTAFVGASPELLVRRSGSRVTSQPMAGSVARGRDEGEDERLARRLLESSAYRSEHRVVPRWVVERLAALSLQVEEPPAPEVVRFTNIQHLATTIHAELRQPAPSLLEVAARLHPTPAVAGLPLEAALDLIQELEAMDRGWYAGGVGWIDAAGDGEIAIALRCGLLWEDGARLYAGNGIIAGADPAAEFDETEVKLQALLGALQA